MYGNIVEYRPGTHELEQADPAVDANTRIYLHRAFEWSAELLSGHPMIQLGSDSPHPLMTSRSILQQNYKCISSTQTPDQTPHIHDKKNDHIQLLLAFTLRVRRRTSIAVPFPSAIRRPCASWSKLVTSPPSTGFDITSLLPRPEVCAAAVGQSCSNATNTANNGTRDKWSRRSEGRLQILLIRSASIRTKVSAHETMCALVRADDH